VSRALHWKQLLTEILIYPLRLRHYSDHQVVSSIPGINKAAQLFLLYPFPHLAAC
jgi:hypothetical protein